MLVSFCAPCHVLAVIAAADYRGSDGPLHLQIDSAGIKVEGEGEWNARKHGGFETSGLAQDPHRNR